MAFVLAGFWTKRRRSMPWDAEPRADAGPRRPDPSHVAKLPYAGINRIRFEGCVSTACRVARVPPLQGVLNHKPLRVGGRRPVLRRDTPLCVALPRDASGHRMAAGMPASPLPADTAFGEKSL